jgi:hypothetical protein
MKSASHRSRLAMIPASEELSSLVAAIEREVSSWPEVRVKRMFGMTAIYRSKQIFGLLPKTRSLRSSDSIWMKFVKLSAATKKKISKEPRIVPPRKPTGAQWYTLTCIVPEDYGFAIEWMALAHKAAISS